MNSIVEKLSKYEEFKNLTEKIDVDINKKGYCIFQALSNEDILKTVDEYEKNGLWGRSFIQNYKLQEILQIQDKTTFIIFKDGIFYDGQLFGSGDIATIIEKNKKNLKEFKKFGSIRKEIRNFDLYSKKFIKIKKSTKKPKSNFQDLKNGLYICIFFGTIIGVFIVITYQTTIYRLKHTTEDYLNYRIMIGTSIILFLYLAIKDLSKRFWRRYIITIPQIISKARKTYNSQQKTNFLYQIKQIEDDIQEIESLNLEKIDLQKSFESDFSSLKNYQFLTQKMSNLLVSISQKLQNLESNQINKSEIFSFAKNNFDIVIKNWLNVLTTIQNNLQTLNKEATTYNQKLFVKTTDNLNSNISFAINQLQTLKI